MMDTKEAMQRMAEGRLYLSMDEGILAVQLDCLEKLYDFNATRPPRPGKAAGDAGRDAGRDW